MGDSSRFQKSKNVILLTGASNLFLSIIKIIFGLLGYSTALFADGLNSGSDVFLDLMVLFASRTGSQAPDSRHPYGHGRFETIFALVLAIVVILVSVGLVYEAVERSFLGVFLKPTYWTLAIAAISIFFNESLYHYNYRVGDRLNSNLLKANAWHRRSDALASIVVFVGIGGELLGLRYLDGVAAIVIALIIFRMGALLAWKSLQELTDSAIDDKEVDQYRELVEKMPGVKSIHQLRTRVLGGSVFVDVHVQVDPFLSVSEGHYIGEQVQRELASVFPNVADVTAHVDSEDDALAMRSILAPSREIFENDFYQACHLLPCFDFFCKTILHYLDGKLEVHIYFAYCDPVLHENLDSMISAYRDALSRLPYIRRVEIFFCVTTCKCL